MKTSPPNKQVATNGTTLNHRPIGGFQLAQVGQVHERDLRQTPGYSPKKTPCQIDFIKLRSIYII